MLEIPVYSPDGSQVETVQVDEALFGSKVRRELLRAAIVRHEANQHVGTATTKGRGLVAGSTKKIYRQKGTGRARMGTVRTNVRRGGGVAFGKKARSFRQSMPKQARRAALDSALLSKMIDGAVCVLSNLEIATPKTKSMTAILKALKVSTTCLLTIGNPNENIWKSSRNLPRLKVRPVSELNPWEVLWPKRLIFTREAFDALVSARSN